MLGPDQEYYGVQSYNVATGRTVGFLSSPISKATTLNVVISSPVLRRMNGRVTAFVRGVHFVDHRGVPGLFKVDVATGRSELTEPGVRGSYDWLVSPDGAPLARADYDENHRRWSLKIRSARGWEERISADAPIERPSIVGLSPDGAGVLLEMLQNDRWQITAVSTAENVSTEPLSKAGFKQVIEDPVTHRVIGGMRLEATYVYEFFSPKDQAAWDAVVKAFPGETVQLESWSDNRRRIVVRVDGPTAGASFALVDLDAHKADWVGDLYGLVGADISPVSQISYPAADGLRIPAYLTLPRGREPKGLPLVVLPHGGPAARDTPQFDWWAQALAAQGYAVLQPQFRGSDGFGRSFLAAGFGEWGRKMQSDLSDGVRKLVKDGVVDPARVCIVGASYGGYAALAGAALDTGVYRCAASIAGLSDLRRFLSWRASLQRSRDTPQMRYWTRFMGADNPRDPQLSAISPAEHIDAVKIPILLVHGEDDTVVNFEQSRIMANALTKAGKPVTLVTLKGEDHWLSREPTRKQMLAAVVDFLKVHNPPQ